MPYESAIIPRRRRSVFKPFLRDVKRDSRSRMSTILRAVDPTQVVQTVHVLLLADCDGVAADSNDL